MPRNSRISGAGDDVEQEALRVGEATPAPFAKRPDPYLGSICVADDDLRRHGMRIEPIAIRDVPLSDIDDTDTSLQFRFGSESKQLRASMESEEQLTPIRIAYSRARRAYVIIDGFCRVAAAKALGWRMIKAYLYAYEDEADLKKMAFLMNVVRKNLSPAERANAMRLASRRGQSNDVIAKTFGVKPKTVTRALALPEDILAVVDGEIVTIAHGRVLAGFGKQLGNERVRDVAEEVRREKLTAEQLKARLRKRYGACGGRPRRFACVSPDGRVQIYAANLGPNSRREDLETAIQNLRSAAERLEELRDRT